MSLRIVPLPARSEIHPSRWPLLYARKLRAFLDEHPLTAGLLKAGAIFGGLGALFVVTVYLRGDPREGPALTPLPPTKVVRHEPALPVVLPAIKLVSAKGRVAANAEVDIRSGVGGMITRLSFDVGDCVKKGEVVAEIDPRDEQRAVKCAQSVLAASQARLVQARQNLVIAEKAIASGRARTDAALKASAARAQRAQNKADRLKQTVQMNFISQEQYDAAEAEAVETGADVESCRVQLQDLKAQELALEVRRQDVRCAEAQVEIDEQSLSAAQQRLADTTLRAPMDGVVIARAAQVGQLQLAGATVASNVLTLADLSRLFVEASVSENQLGQIEIGQEAVITADAFPDVRFKGKVVRVSAKGTRAGDAVTFGVRVEVIDDRKSLLHPEMTARVEFLPTPRP